MVVVGSHDCSIYAYSFPDWKQKCKPMKKHSSYITHIDFSRDGNYLHSTCGAYELLFWDANSGKQMTSGASALKDEIWQTWTVTLGWPVKNIEKIIAILKYNFNKLCYCLGTRNLARMR